MGIQIMELKKKLAIIPSMIYFMASYLFKGLSLSLQDHSLQSWRA